MQYAIILAKQSAANKQGILLQIKDLYFPDPIGSLSPSLKFIFTIPPEFKFKAMLWRARIQGKNPTTNCQPGCFHKTRDHFNTLKELNKS